MSDQANTQNDDNKTDSVLNTPESTSSEPLASTEPTPNRTTTLPENTAKPAIVVQQKSSGKGLAIGALVLSLLALGASGFLFVQGQNTLKNQELQFNQSLDKAALGNTENSVLLQNTLTQQNLLNQQVDNIKKAQIDNELRLNNVQVAYSELLKGRVNWLVDEVEVSLNIASQQLLLSGNVPVAVGILENIEQRLSRFEQPELLPIKQAISQDLATLKALPYINIPATTLHLDRLQNSINDLPLMVDDTLQVQNKPSPASQANNFMQRTWENTVNMVKDMVEVRHLQSNDTMLLAPEQIYFIRENLRLRLLDARLALMQHNSEVYQNDLNAVDATVKQYFNNQAQSTQNWLKELNELKTLDVQTVSDETLKNSINAVRVYQNNIQTINIALPENAASGASSADASAATNAPSEEKIKSASQPEHKAGGKVL